MSDDMWYSFGKMLVTLGVLMLVLGCLIIFAGRFTSLGRLPGDIFIHKGNFTFYFPIVTTIIISLLLTLILNFFNRR